MANYLPNGDNCTALFAESYFREDTPGSRYVHMGIVDSATWTPEVEVAEKSYHGKVVATKTTSKGATLAIVAGELTWRNFISAFMATESDLIQAAGAVSGTATEVSPGELIELGGYGITGLVLTNGATTLVAGVDYTYDPATNFAQILTEQSEIDWEGTRAAITAGQRKVMSLLANDSGLKGFFRFVGVNDKGQKVLIDEVKAELRPDGAVTISSDSGEFGTISLTGKALLNPLNVAHPYGFALALN